MVLINEKKYACATCIKGHRVSGCTHTDRPLFEVKKKGRPATQCQFCRERRKGSIGPAGAGAGSTIGSGSTVHNKCVCGEKIPIPSSISTAVAAANANEILPSSGSKSASADPSPLPRQMLSQVSSTEVETKKGVPGSIPTFPNGLRDVHDMAAAAEALTGLQSEGTQAVERRLQHLLNPCHCKMTGKCKCCGPKKRSPSPPRQPTPPRSDSHSQVTDSLIEMFKAKATTTSTPPEGSGTGVGNGSGTSTPTILGQRAPPIVTQNIISASTFLSPDNMYHPAHTSPHVHKTKLYSPYSTGGHSTPRHSIKRGESSAPSMTPLPHPATSVSPVPPYASYSGVNGTASGWASSKVVPTAPRLPLPKIRPLADMNKFLGAVFREDGTVANEIPRSALGLPGIHVFDAVARNGGVKVESMEMEMDVDNDTAVAFPTAEDVVIGACTCGDGCDCPGCATHGNQPGQSSSSSSTEHAGHDGSCGDSCRSCFDCADHLSIPSGVQSIEQLISLAAAKVPSNPPRTRAVTDLNPHDTRVLPPAAQSSEEAARTFGLVQLRPLECCNGRCQCPPGQCTCDNECCGCCSRCACDDDGDANMADGESENQSTKANKSCCSGSDPSDTVDLTQLVEPIPVAASHAAAVTIVPNAQVSPVTGSQFPPTSNSPHGSNTSTPITSTPPNGAATGSGVGHSTPALRRAASVSRAKEAFNSGNAGVRRISVSANTAQGSAGSIQRSSSVGGKAASKALALHTLPHHPRPILPKPVAGPGGAPAPGVTRLAPPRQGSVASRQPSPVARAGSGSSQPSRTGSPAITIPPLPHTESVPLMEVSGVVSTAPASVSNESRSGTTTDYSLGGLSIGVDDLANALAASDVDFMSYLNQLLSSTSSDDAAAAGLGGVGMTAASEGSTSSYPPSEASYVGGSGGLPVTQMDGSLPDVVSTESGSTSSDFNAQFDIQQLMASALAEQGVTFGLQSQQQQQQIRQQQPNMNPAFNYFFNLPTDAHADLIPPRDLQLAQAQAEAQARAQVQAQGNTASKTFYDFRSVREVTPPQMNFLGPEPRIPAPAASVLATDASILQARIQARTQSLAQLRQQGQHERHEHHHELQVQSGQPAPEPFFKPTDDLYFSGLATAFPTQIGTHVTPDPKPHGLPAPVASQQAQPPHIKPPHAPLPAPPNPDIIDLSKPLNPQDVDRILQALLKQQDRQSEVDQTSTIQNGVPQIDSTASDTGGGSVRGGMMSDVSGVYSTSSQDPFDEYIFDPAALLPTDNVPLDLGLDLDDGIGMGDRVDWRDTRLWMGSQAESSGPSIE